MNNEYWEDNSYGIWYHDLLKEDYYLWLDSFEELLAPSLDYEE